MTAIAGTHTGVMRRNVQRAAHDTAYRAPDPVAIALSRRLGITIGNAHQVIVGGLAHRCAAVVAAHIEIHAHDRLARWLQPIWDAEAAVQAPALTSDLMLTTVKMDAADDVARAEYLAHPSQERQDAADDIARVHYLAHPSQESARALARAYGRTMAKLRLEQLALGERWDFTP
jgi:hypothetical protein